MEREHPYEELREQNSAESQYQQERAEESLPPVAEPQAPILPSGESAGVSTLDEPADTSISGQQVSGSAILSQSHTRSGSASRIADLAHTAEWARQNWGK